MAEVKRKTVIIGGTSYDYVSLDESIEFICRRCSKRKISKKYATPTVSSPSIRLCNGCFGKLSSVAKEGK